MRIVKLTSENVKRLKAVAITPDGAIVQISGRNGQGKTSVLDSIEMLLGGKDHGCAMPVRKGQVKARVVAKMDDGLTVTRTFTPDGGGTLTVVAADGAKYPSPQSILDRLVGKLTFDPLAFSRQPNKQQAETLRALVGLDFAAADAQRKALYDRRGLVNASAKQLDGQLAAMPEHPDAPAEEVSVSALATEMERRKEVNEDNARARAAVAEADAKASACGESMKAASAREKESTQECGDQVKELEAQYEAEKLALEKRFAGLIQNTQTRYGAEQNRARADWNKAQKSRQAWEAEREKQKAAASGAVDLDTREVLAQMSAAEATNRKVRENIRRAEVLAEVDAARAKSKLLTSQIEALDRQKAEAIAAAPFPVPGLAFDDTGVVFNSVPFSQASSAEQLRVSVAMGLALNPKLRVMLIRDGSLLDKESMAMLEHVATEQDAQIWIETVSDGQGVGIVIEDGQVADPIKVGEQ